jgi:creatinine amidohydrolase
VTAVEVELAHAAWPELGAADEILLVPVGATEQHGPHLPLGTDTEIALALAAAAARRSAHVRVAPAVAYGSSGEHGGFAGTLSIGLEAIELLLVELCRSATASFRRVMLVCTHGGNARAVQGALATVRAEGRDVRAFSPDWSSDAHGGHAETSLMLAIRPERVRQDRAQAGNTRPLSELIGALQIAGVREVSPNGVLGDPTAAGATEGRRLLSEATEALVSELEAWP